MFERKKRNIILNQPKFKIGDKVEIVGTISTADECIGKIINMERYREETWRGKLVGYHYWYTVKITRAGKSFRNYNMKQLGWKIKDKHTFDAEETFLNLIRRVKDE